MTNKEKLINEFFEVTEKAFRIFQKSHTVNPEKKLATILQFQALVNIKENNGITVGELAKKVIMTSGGVAQLIERLLQSDWITKIADKKDGRIFHLYITKTGENQLVKIKEFRKSKMTEIISLIPETDIKDMIRIHTKLLKKLEERNKNE